MSGATFERIKNWTREVLTNEDLNAEIDNILNNLGPAGIDDFSASIAQMRLTENPGGVGSESLATSLAGEVQRLRYMIGLLSGESEWYGVPAASLSDLSASGGIPQNRVVSGHTRAGSLQPIFLLPAGSSGGATLTARGAPTALLYRVNDALVTVDENVQATGLSTAPATNNTATVDGAHSKTAGELGTDTVLTMSGAGTEITNLTGRMAGFKVTVGSDDEYFIARVTNSTTLERGRRGYFFDEDDLPIPRLELAGDETITLMRLHWVFGTLAGGITTTTIEPIYSGTEPAGVVTGQYWFDHAAEAWKLFDGSTFILAEATLIGMALTDSSDCVAARSFDVHSGYDELGFVRLVRSGNDEIASREFTTRINVYGNEIRTDADFLAWTMDDDLEAGFTEAADTEYFIYMTERGVPRLSPEVPYHRLGDLRGFYHPYHSWRALGSVTNDEGSNFDGATLKQFEVIRSDVFGAHVGGNLTVRRDTNLFGDLNFDSAAAFPSFAVNWKGEHHSSFRQFDLLVNPAEGEGFGSVVLGAGEGAITASGSVMRITRPMSGASRWLELEDAASIAGRTLQIGNGALGEIEVNAENQANLLVKGPGGPSSDYGVRVDGTGLVGVIGSPRVEIVGGGGTLLATNNDGDQASSTIIRDDTVSSGDANLIMDDSTGRIRRITSALKYKKDVEDVLNAEDLLKLRPVTFRGKNESDDAMKSYGFIAEEVAATVPELAVYKDGEPESVAYSRVPALLVAYVQKLEERVAALEEKLNGGE